MKKTLLMAAAATMMFALPAMAEDNDMSDAEMTRAKVEYKLSKVDSSKDGMITKAEMQTFMDSMFNDADANDDGNISREELTASVDKERDEMKEFKDDMKDGDMPNSGG